MKLKGIVLSSFFVLGLFANDSASAIASFFRIAQIQFIGLLRIPSATALSYLPVKPSGMYRSEDGQAVIHSLYSTGYFSDVKVYRSGNNLVIKVKEWPVIGRVRIEGNKEIKSKALEPILKNMGIKPMLMKVITPDIKNAINSAIKNGKRIFGFLICIH